MDENASQQSNKIAGNDELTKLARIAPTQGIEAGALNRRSMLEILMHFTLVLFL